MDFYAQIVHRYSLGRLPWKGEVLFLFSLVDMFTNSQGSQEPTDHLQHTSPEAQATAEHPKEPHPLSV